ncbi:hypothetical protein TIFTF001_031337 [Ficus carica]|uniref:Uncharacterized protein n=1 Tax=Ficus carica TaxID=3494 RepID=A0AA88J0U3_FICCA|nr:hypothetical protein TIFTF001_031337 [Ficus carica]
MAALLLTPFERRHIKRGVVGGGRQGHQFLGRGECLCRYEMPSSMKDIAIIASMVAKVASVGHCGSHRSEGGQIVQILSRSVAHGWLQDGVLVIEQWVTREAGELAIWG